MSEYGDMVAYLRGLQSVVIDRKSPIVRAMECDGYCPVTPQVPMDGSLFQLAQADINDYRLYYQDVGCDNVFYISI